VGVQATEIALAPPGVAVGHRRRVARRRRLRTAVLVVVVALVAPLAWSYGSALAAGGTDGLGVRSVEWLKDHGGAGLVRWVEKEWYSHHAPPVGGRPDPRLVNKFAKGHVGASVAAAWPPHLAAPTPIAPLAAPLPDEGVWHPVGRLVGGRPAVYATWVRPDAVHTSLVTGVAWIDTRLVRATLFAGYQEPGGAGWRYTAPIPPALATTLVAAFNSGFRLRDGAGGYYSEGRTVRPLRDGLASLVIRSDGTATVGQWGRDVSMSPQVDSVRQNLSLIVDGGAPVPGLDTESYRRWGSTLGNKVLVWRSGVGVTASGALVYAGGRGLSVGSLAQVLARAGAVRAMELDINTEWVSFYYFNPPVGQPASPANGSKLVADMYRPTTRYFLPSSRDFFAFFARY